ncbi:HAD family hydrolase [Lapillicoccus sp.]|uniref:HAD family hydrolase n=1 Tax=Lapillicoccus sp. TaxID=1909287 RepID=UPI003265B104
MTDGLPALLAALGERSYAIVSNNSTDSVEKFAALHLGGRPPAVIFGKPALRPDLMKPSPYLLNAVLEKLDRLPDEAVFVGDAVSDTRPGTPPT